MSDEKPAPLPPTPVLETPRLVLRPIRAEDIDAMRRRFGQWDVVKHLSASVPWPLPPDNFEVAMADTLEKMARGERCSWAITRKEDPGELIGRIDLWAETGERDQRGFWLDPEFWGRGLMTEAADRVTEYAFTELDWPQLYLCNAEANIASHRVKEKQGARIIDRIPATYVSGPGTRVVWLLERDVWLARRGPSPKA
jgi:[ribosomal protein S5]-alanine N-acetyltransferase